MVAIPDEYHDLFEKATFAHLGTMNSDGLPHITPVWVGYDAGDNRVLVNTERGRQKERNAREDPTVGMSMCDPDDPYRYLAFVGEVDEMTTEGAREHIDELAHRYTGDDYHNEIITERVVLRIRPDNLLQR